MSYPPNDPNYYNQQPMNYNQPPNNYYQQPYYPPPGYNPQFPPPGPDYASNQYISPQPVYNQYDQPNNTESRDFVPQTTGYGAVAGVNQELYNSPHTEHHRGTLGKIFGMASGVLSSSHGGGDAESSVRELLSEGIGEGVRVLSVQDGYFSHAIVKILLPSKLQKIADKLHKFGLSSKIDKLILSMNRAAEAAAAQALHIFQSFIMKLHFHDVKAILHGGDTAATQFFRERSEEDLKLAYKPVVQQTMNQWGVTRQYSEISSHVSSIPFISDVFVDIEDYTVTKALDGLFHVMGEKERAIRKDPAKQIGSLIGSFFKH